MAERRMFSMAILDSDGFLELPLSAQSLYFHLSMRADDDGFVNNPNKIRRMIDGEQADYLLLAQKEFLIVFDSGICVIRHWRIHNCIRSDRYKRTFCSAEKQALTMDENGMYHRKSESEEATAADADAIGIPRGNQMDTIGIPDDNQVDTIGIPSGNQVTPQVRLGKDSLEKDSVGKATFLPEAPARSDTQPPAIEFLLNDKSLFPIHQSRVEEWTALYPAVDVLQQLRNMCGWLDANPERRKTKSGILRFANNWLAKEQNKAAPRESPPPKPAPQQDGEWNGDWGILLAKKD